MTALIEAIYDMVNQNQAVCRVLILENTNSTVLMRMIALAKDDSIAYWRKELPNASETDLVSLPRWDSGAAQNVIDLFLVAKREQRSFGARCPSATLSDVRLWGHASGFDV